MSKSLAEQKYPEPRALSEDERIILMRVILNRTLYQFPKPLPMMQEESTQRALHGGILTSNELRFYIDRVALWDA